MIHLPHDTSTTCDRNGTMTTSTSPAPYILMFHFAVVTQVSRDTPAMNQCVSPTARDTARVLNRTCVAVTPATKDRPAASSRAPPRTCAQVN